MSSRRQPATRGQKTATRRQPATRGQKAETRRQKALRPSRKERAPYTDALEQGFAEGRLTHALYDERLAEAEKATSFDTLDALVADLPFDPPARPAQPTNRGSRGPRGRGFVLPAVAALIAAGAMFAIVVEGGGDATAEDTAAEETAAEAAVAGQDRPPAGWEPPSVAGELDAVETLDTTTVRAALDRAREAGFTRIEQVVLKPDATTVSGMADAGSNEGEEVFRLLHLRPDNAGVVSDADGNTGYYLDEPDSLDVDLDALISAAREATDAGADQDVRAVLVYRGDGSARRQYEEGNLVMVSFVQGANVTLRASDHTVLW